MSTTHIDRVHIPAYQQAVALILKLASPLFLRATRDDSKLDRFYLHHWVSLRLIANKFLEKRSRALAPELQFRLIAALEVCRRLAADGPVIDTDHCICDVASLLDRLSLVLAAEAGTEVPLA